MRPLVINVVTDIDLLQVLDAVVVPLQVMMMPTIAKATLLQLATVAGKKSKTTNQFSVLTVLPEVALGENGEEGRENATNRNGESWNEKWP